MTTTTIQFSTDASLSARQLFTIGREFYLGINRYQDYRKAVEHCKAAAKQGEINAMLQLASWCRRGVVMNEDLQLANDYLELACYHAIKQKNDFLFGEAKKQLGLLKLDTHY